MTKLSHFCLLTALGSSSLFAAEEDVPKPVDARIMRYPDVSATQKER